MSPDDVRHLPPIAPLTPSSLDDHDKPSPQEDMDQKLAAVDSTALLTDSASLSAATNLSMPYYAAPNQVEQISCPRCTFLNPLGTSPCKTCGAFLATSAIRESAHESIDAEVDETSNHNQGTRHQETSSLAPTTTTTKIKICPRCTSHNVASATRCDICSVILGNGTLHNLSPRSVDISLTSSDKQPDSTKDEELVEWHSRMERMEAMLQEQQEINQEQQETIKKQRVEMTRISKKLDKLEKAKEEEDTGKPVNIDSLIALEKDELIENGPAIQGGQENFNFDMEDRMSRIYTHVAGLEEDFAASRKQQEDMEILVYRLAADRQRRQGPVGFLMSPRRSTTDTPVMRRQDTRLGSLMNNKMKAIAHQAMIIRKKATGRDGRRGKRK